MTLRDAVVSHFANVGDHSRLDYALTVIMFWPLLPFSLANGHYWLWRLAAIPAYLVLFVVNIPFFIAFGIPMLFAAIVRDIWREMSK